MVLPPEGYSSAGWQLTKKEKLSTASFYKIWLAFMIGIASPVGQ